MLRDFREALTAMTGDTPELDPHPHGATARPSSERPDLRARSRGCSSFSRVSHLGAVRLRASGEKGPHRRSVREPETTDGVSSQAPYRPRGPKAQRDRDTASGGMKTEPPHVLT